MSAKHHQRTRTRKLARRDSPRTAWVYPTKMPKWAHKYYDLTRQVRDPAWQAWASKSAPLAV